MSEGEITQLVVVFFCWVLVVGVAAMFYKSSGDKGLVTKKPPSKERGARHPTATKGLVAEATYEKNQLLTLEEKKYYRLLSDYAYDYGYTVFVKVPLFFILQPKQRSKQFASAISSLATSYVDFVLCDSALKVSLVIVIEPTPKALEDSMTRDTRLDSVLQSCGVGVLHTLSIDNDTRHWIEEQVRQRQLS